MSAIIGVSILHIVALGLLWFGLRRPRALMPIAAGYGVMIAGIVVYQTGLMAGATAASQLPPPPAQAAVSNRQCREIIAVLTENRVILAPPSAERLVVARAIWEQVPEPVRSQVVSCVEQMRPAGTASAPIEVVQQ